MRSAIIAAAFAAGSFAVPLMERDVVYETDIAYTTVYATVTAGDVAPSEAPASSSVQQYTNHWGHGHRKPKTASQSPQGYTSYWSTATTWTQTASVETSAAQEQPAYTPPAYTNPEEQAPAPTAYESSSSYEQPSSSYEAPSSSYEAPSSSAPASSASDPKPTDFKSTVEHHHNIHRYNHSSPALSWNESLAQTAEKIANLCRYEHMMTMDGGGYGQNIAAGVKADNISAVLTDMMYNGEEPLYAAADNYGKGAQNPDGTPVNDGWNDSDFEGWGHMTQMVWKETTAVGCAVVDCSSRGLSNTGANVSPYFTVCNYYPQGNVQNQYKDNVISPRGDRTCYWNDGQ